MDHEYSSDTAYQAVHSHEPRNENHYRPATLRAKQLRTKRELAEDKYEVADDMAFAELISYASVGVDPFHAHENHEAKQ